MRPAIDHRPVILRQAARLFARRRFDEVLMDEVARRAGLAKGTLYRFYRTKEALYQAVCTDWMKDLVRKMRLAASARGEVPERLRGTILCSVEHFLQSRDFFQVLQRQEGQFAALRRSELLRVRATIRGIYERLIREGQRAGTFRGLEAGQAADMLMGMLRSLTLFGKAPVSASEVTRVALEFFFHGMLLPGRDGMS